MDELRETMDGLWEDCIAAFSRRNYADGNINGQRMIAQSLNQLSKVNSVAPTALNEALKCLLLPKRSCLQRYGLQSSIEIQSTDNWQPDLKIVSALWDSNSEKNSYLLLSCRACNAIGYTRQSSSHLCVIIRLQYSIVFTDLSSWQLTTNNQQLKNSIAPTGLIKERVVCCYQTVAPTALSDFSINRARNSDGLFQWLIIFTGL